MSSANHRGEILVVDPIPGFRTLLSKALTNGDGAKTLEADIPSEVTGILDKHAELSVVIFGPDAAQGDVRRVASDLQIRFPEVATILVSRELSSEVLFESLHSGIRDVLPISFTTTQLQQAVARADDFSRRISHRSSDLIESGDGITTRKVITVIGAKTGCGSSFVAANLAVLLTSGESQRVVLVDLNFLSGDLAVMFQIRPSWTIAELAALDRLDGVNLGDYLTHHESGVALLAAPFEAQESPIEDGHVRRILAALHDLFPFVVVDASTALPDLTFAALEESDEVILVATLDVPSARNLMFSLRRIEQVGIGRDRIRLVLNRANSKVGLSKDDIEKAIGTTFDFIIPSSREVPLSINEGAPVASTKRKSSVAAALQGLARAVGGSSLRAPRSRFLRR